jgi:hypothetical protein
MNEGKGEPQTAMDGPNTHRYRDAHFVTSWTLFRLTDPDGVEHTFHVPTLIVEQIVAVEVLEASRNAQIASDPFALATPDHTEAQEGKE